MQLNSRLTGEAGRGDGGAAPHPGAVRVRVKGVYKPEKSRQRGVRQPRSRLTGGVCWRSWLSLSTPRDAYMAASLPCS